MLLVVHLSIHRLKNLHVDSSEVGHLASPATQDLLDFIGSRRFAFLWHTPVVLRSVRCLRRARIGGADAVWEMRLRTLELSLRRSCWGCDISGKAANKSAPTLWQPSPSSTLPITPLHSWFVG